jgi:UDP-N-acetylmuramyl pentapeptide synthase
VTPGLLELGRESNKVHEQLGKCVIGNADYVILVGRNESTESLARGINKKVKVIWIEKTLSFMKVVKELKLKKEPLVLKENDIPLGF